MLAIIVISLNLMEHCRPLCPKGGERGRLIRFQEDSPCEHEPEQNPSLVILAAHGFSR